jgi:hypothetical protein
MATVSTGYIARPQFEPFHRRKRRWGISVCHRRAGKTVAKIKRLAALPGVRRVAVENFLGTVGQAGSAENEEQNCAATRSPTGGTQRRRSRSG